MTMMSVPSSKMRSVGEATSVCVIKLLTGCIGPAQGIWIAAYTKNQLLSLAQIGWLASTESAMTVFGILCVSTWGPKFSPRTIAAACLALIACGALLATASPIEMFVGGRLLTLFGWGSLLACINVVIGRRSDALKLFALVGGIAMLATSGVYLMLPLFVGLEGLVRLFLVTAGMSAVAAMTLKGLSKHVYASAAQVRSTPDRRTLKFAPLIGCIALACAGAASGAVLPFQIVIGDTLGFNSETLGRIIGVSGAFGLLGPVIAHRLGERAGLVVPTVVCIVILGISWFVVVNAPSAIIMGLGLSTAFVSIGFLYPYAMTLIARLDDVAGRLVGAAPAFLLLGTALGSKIGATALGAGGIGRLAIAAGLLLLATIVLIVAAAWKGGLFAEDRLFATIGQWVGKNAPQPEVRD